MKKSRKKNRNAVILFIILAVIIVISCIIFKDDKIHISRENVKFYISTADEASKEKLQVNWQQLAAVDAVRYGKDFTKVDHSSTKELAKMFIVKSKDNKYRLLTLDEVLTKLDFSMGKKEKVFKYLKQLEYVGIKKQNLNFYKSQMQFISELKPEAIELYKKYGILPSVAISQAILESGWGKSELSVKANNLFGIKADRGWDGKSVSMKTSEYYNKTIMANFRAYDSIARSLKDYGEFLYNNKRYKRNGLFSASNYIGQANAIERAGYSTKENKNGDRIYAEAVINVIQENNLQLIDYEAQMQKQYNH